MWGVYLEARDWNVGALCLDFKPTTDRPTNNLALRAALGSLTCMYEALFDNVKVRTMPVLALPNLHMFLEILQFRRKEKKYLEMNVVIDLWENDIN